MTKNTPEDIALNTLLAVAKERYPNLSRGFGDEALWIAETLSV